MRSLLVLAIIALSFSGFSAHAESKLSGKVVGVTDGDTITVLTPMREQIKVRLAEIDAPEHDQPFGYASKQFLSAMVFGKEVTLLVQTKDRYHRSIAIVYIGNTDVNLQLVKNGTAWAYRKYLKDPLISKAEDYARSAKLGLWGLQADQIIPPWEWRHRSKKSH